MSFKIELSKNLNTAIYSPHDLAKLLFVENVKYHYTFLWILFFLNCAL